MFGHVIGDAGFGFANRFHEILTRAPPKSGICLMPDIDGFTMPLTKVTCANTEIELRGAIVKCQFTYLAPAESSPKESVKATPTRGGLPL